MSTCTRSIYSQCAPHFYWCATFSNGPPVYWPVHYHWGRHGNIDLQAGPPRRIQDTCSRASEARKPQWSHTIPSSRTTPSRSSIRRGKEYEIESILDHRSVQNPPEYMAILSFSELLRDYPFFSSSYSILRCECRFQNPNRTCWIWWIFATNTLLRIDSYESGGINTQINHMR